MPIVRCKLWSCRHNKGEWSAEGGYCIKAEILLDESHDTAWCQSAEEAEES